MKPPPTRPERPAAKPSTVKPDAPETWWQEFDRVPAWRVIVLGALLGLVVGLVAALIFP